MEGNVLHGENVDYCEWRTEHESHDWLLERGDRPIIIIGISFGSTASMLVDYVYIGYGLKLMKFIGDREIRLETKGDQLTFLYILIFLKIWHTCKANLIFW